MPNVGPPVGTTRNAPYHNPFRAVRGLTRGRIDQGVDYYGSGPVYALGPGTVLRSVATGSGWPGGGFLAYRLDAGPDKGQIVYVAENFTPSVSVGDHVTWTDVVGDMHGGIETGWGAGGANLG